jgi:hypothetical protein
MPFADVTGLPFNGSDGVTWTGPGTFQVIPSSGMTALTAGLYYGSITVTTAGAANLVIPVQVIVVASQTVRLTVSKTGTGSGTVTSTPAGINCGTTCSRSYSTGTPVTLTAAPNTGSTFTGWSVAGCSGTGACTVPMTAQTSLPWPVPRTWSSPTASSA